VHDFGLFELAQKLKYILVSVGTVWNTGSLFRLSLAVVRFVGIMGTSFAVVLVRRVTVRTHFIVLRSFITWDFTLADTLWKL
jgi:hypothetical protein